jgi:dTMP kinase
MKGVFIAVEGIDACGKGTIAKGLATELFEANKNHHVFLTREPYQRDWLKKFLSQLDPLSQGEQALQLFVEDRAKHCKMIDSNLKKGVIVISDRYKHSTYAYQMAQGITFEKIHQAHQGLLVPDLTIVIDITAEEAERRMQQDRITDAHAFHNKEFLTKVRENYLKLKELLKENIIFIDGNRNKEAVFADAYKAAQELLKQTK